MKVAEMREQLYDMIRVADDKKVKAIYTLLENETPEENEWWKDEAFIAELDKRYEAWESGKEKGYTLEEMKASVQALFSRQK
jgi:hypothetical protein